MWGGVAALTLFVVAFCIGLVQGKVIATLSLIGTAVLLEAQPAAVASIPLGFHPFSGAIISIIGNLIPIPFLMLGFNEIVRRWKWLNRKLKKAEVWTRKFAKYGIWILPVLTPFLGAYVCIGVGLGMGWRLVRVFVSVVVGVVLSTFLLTYGGHWVVGLFGG